jgi:Glutaminase
MPAKSGLSGCIIAVIPGQIGICVYSPPIDQRGNSLRGIRGRQEISKERRGQPLLRAGPRHGQRSRSGCLDRATARVASIGPGLSFGEMALLDGGKRSADFSPMTR